MRKGKRRGLSLLLALVLLLGLLPGTAWAGQEETEFSVAISDCVQIGDYDDGYAPLYLCSKEAPAEASSVVFPDFEGKMDGMFSMIASLGNAMEMNTNTAPISGDYALDPAKLEEDAWTIDEAYQTYDFSNCYAYWIVDDDDNETYFIIKAAEV